MRWSLKDLEEWLLIGSTLVEGSTLSEDEARAVLAGRSVTAMEFLLSDGIMPESGLPVASFLALEDWLRARGSEQGPKAVR